MKRQGSKGIGAVIRHFDQIVAPGALRPEQVETTKRELAKLKRALDQSDMDGLAKTVNAICRQLLRRK